MQIRGQETVRNGFIKGAIPRGTRIASYDVSVGTIVATDDNQTPHEYTREFAIEPHQMCVIVSKERIHVPEGFVGYALPKTTLCQRGLLTLNTGIIDPGYEGLISTTAINFSLKPIEIRPDDHFLRIVFHELKPEVKPEIAQSVCPTDHEYLNKRREEARQYPRAFLDIPSHLRKFSAEIKNEIFAAVGSRFQWYVAVIALIFTGGNLWLNLTAKSKAESAGAKYVAEVHDISASVLNHAITAQNLTGAVHDQANTIASIAAQINVLKTAGLVNTNDLEIFRLHLKNLETTELDLEKRINALERRN